MESLLLLFFCSAVLIPQAFGRSGNEEGRKFAPTKEDFYARSISPEGREAAAAADRLRDETIDSILVLQKDDSSMTAKNFELLLRLGELYVEKHDYQRGIEIETFEKAYDTWAKVKKGAEPKASYENSRRSLASAAKAFRDLVRLFPKHPRIDAALYALATTLSRLGSETAELYFNELIKNHPKSPLIADAQLSLGEHYFDAHKMDQAIGAYKAAAKSKDHKAYPYVVYKLGWAYYNLQAKNAEELSGNLDKAVSALMLVVQLAKKDKTNFGQIDLGKEAIQDLVIFWADSGDVDSAWAYFSKIGEEESFYNMLERLGLIYIDQGKYDLAIQLFSRVLSEAPLRDRNAKVHSRLTELFEVSGQPEKVVEAGQKMLKLYVNESSWTKSHKSDSELLKESVDTVADSLHRYGTLFHDRGEKSKDQSLLKAACALYELYLSAFSNREPAYDIRYYMADLLFDLGQFEKSSENFTLVAKAKPKDGKYLQVSAMNAVVALIDLDKTTKYDALPKFEELMKAKVTLPSLKEKLVKALDQYVSLLPKDKDAPKMAYTAASTLYQFGDFSSASERFKTLVSHYQNSEEAAGAAQLLVDYMVKSSDWTNAISWLEASRAASATLADSNALKMTLDSLYFRVLQENAVAFEKTKKYKEAADSYANVYKVFPKHENADQFLYSVATNYFRAGVVGDAINAQELLLKNHGYSKLIRDVVADLAQTYESVADFEKAAKYYELFYRKYPNDKRANNSLYNAALLNQGLNNTTKAISLYQTFVSRPNGGEMLPKAFLAMAQIQTENGTFQEAMDSYLQYTSVNANQEENLFAQAKSVELRLALRESHARSEMYKLRRLLTQKDAPLALNARNVVGKNIFSFTQANFDQFQNYSFNAKKDMNRQIKEKQMLLEELAKRFNDIIALASPEYTVASYFRLGEMHENFANQLLATSVEGQDEASLAFKAELEKLAFPLRDEAYKFFKTAYQKAQEVDTFTAWTQKAYQKMVDLMPAENPEIKERNLEASYLSHKLSQETLPVNLAR